MSHLKLILLAVLSARLTVFGRAENKGTALPFPFSSLPAFAPTYESVKSPECRKHGLTYLRELEELKLWAVQMYDASGKVPSGLLRGNSHWLGDDRECLQVSSKPGAADGDPEVIRGQYCSFRVFANPRGNSSTNGDLVEIFDHIHTHNMVYNTAEDSIIFFPSFSYHSIGICVPHSCSTEDIEAALVEWLAPLNSSAVDIRLVVTQTSCIKEERDLSGSYAVMAFALAMTLVGLVGALYQKRKETGDASKKEGKLVSIFLAFSLRSNIRVLLDTTAPTDELSCLNGIRTIFSFILFFLHRGLILFFGGVSNRAEFVELIVGPKSMILRAFWNHVDSFVVMSGLLTSYYAVKNLQEGKKLNIIKMYIRRYIKLTPLYAMCILFSMSVLDITASNAQYTNQVNYFITCCKEAWLNVITYTNTFRGFEKMCHQPSHQLETDMHMYILSPFIILMLWKMGKSSILPACFTIIALSAMKFHTIYSKDLGTIIYYGFPLTHMVSTANNIYLNFLHRLVPYMAGILLGFLLRLRRENFKLSSVQFFVSGVLALYSVYYSFFYMVHASYPGYVFNLMEHALFGVFQPLLWSYCISWVIFACANGQAEIINKFLSWKGFMITSRLAYAFYLIQIPMMLTEVGRNSNPSMVSPVTLLDLNIFFICLGGAIWSTLLFAIPIGNLWKIFTESSQKTTKEEKNE